VDAADYYTLVKTLARVELAAETLRRAAESMPDEPCSGMVRIAPRETLKWLAEWEKALEGRIAEAGK
jgi:uncharacterized protein YfaT (DUF1175 family)